VAALQAPIKAAFRRHVVTQIALPPIFGFEKNGSLLDVIDCDERHGGVGRPHVILCACCSNQERSMSYERKSSGRDHLTCTTKDGQIELAGEQLSRVGGAYKERGQVAFLKLQVGVSQLKIDTVFNS
jgi:hypothetical protein